MEQLADALERAADVAEDLARSLPRDDELREWLDFANEQRLEALRLELWAAEWAA